MKITLNGDASEVEEGTNLVDLLERHGVAADTRGVAVAVNRAVVPRAAWKSTLIVEGDEVEVIGAVQGG